jgi:hypothetical protein
MTTYNGFPQRFKSAETFSTLYDALLPRSGIDKQAVYHAFAENRLTQAEAETLERLHLQHERLRSRRPAVARKTSARPRRRGWYDANTMRRAEIIRHARYVGAPRPQISANGW